MIPSDVAPDIAAACTADRQLERRLAQGWQARIMHVRGLAPGGFGGFESVEETTSFNVFARRVMDTQGAVWCCRCVARKRVHHHQSQPFSARLAACRRCQRHIGCAQHSCKRAIFCVRLLQMMRTCMHR